MTERIAINPNGGLAAGVGKRLRASSRRITGTPALVLLASLTVSMLASASSPTPLYARYQVEWGFSSITSTVVFGVYAVAVLGGLTPWPSSGDY